jgi:hypothetical protein
VDPEFVTEPKKYCEPLKTTVGNEFKPVVLYVGLPVEVACFPFPDLSYHVVTTELFAGFVPVPRGSAPSNQTCRPVTEFGLKAV